MFESLELTLPQPADAEADEVERAKLREPAVWSAWYDRYFPALYRYALARTNRREDAEDIAAQAFLRALESIDRYDYRGRPVLAWLYRITRNLVADRLRREARRPAVSLDSETAAEPSGEDLNVRNIELQDALRRLKREHREVLVLRYLVALSNREVAALLGKTETAVYSLQARAAENLRRLLRD